MSEAKTKRTKKSVSTFLASTATAHAQRKIDAFDMCALLEQLMQCKLEIQGDSIIGYGAYQSVTSNGRISQWA